MIEPWRPRASIKTYLSNVRNRHSSHCIFPRILGGLVNGKNVHNFDSTARLCHLPCSKAT